MKGTRRDVLFQLELWLKDKEDKRVFWLNGLAGTGKSTIAQTFAEVCFADWKLGASFFCLRDFKERSNLQSIFPTLSFQLALRYPCFRQELLLVLTKNPDVGKESLCSQMEKLIVGPFRAMKAPTLIIIDALDECQDKEPASALLSVLSHYVDDIPQVKFLVTGRPEPRIRSGFRLESLQPHTEVFKLHEVESTLVDSDIKLFLKAQFVNIAKHRSDCNLGEDWPGPQNIDILCKKAAGFFIFASTVVKFVSSNHHPPDERLALIVSLPLDTSHEARLGIDLLYTQVLGQAFQDVGFQDHELYSHLKSVVGAVVLIFHPLSIKTLSDLLMNCGTPTRMTSSLRTLHSLLLVPDNIDDPIRIFHKSFPDFLTDPGRCTDDRFFIDPLLYHNKILLSCLHVMNKRLKRNICSLDDHAVLSEIKDLPTQRATHVGDALEYACCFWTKHLARVSSSSSGVEEVCVAINTFFETELLFWIEVLVLMGKLDIGIYALNDIQQWCILVSFVFLGFQLRPVLTSVQTGVPDKWTSDSKHFILENFNTICDCPSQIYDYALMFSPSTSQLHKCYTPKFPPKVKVVVGPAEWGACTRTVSCNGDYTATLAYQNNSIATGLYNDITIFDALTGSQTAVLSGHTGYVMCIVFSSDGTLLVSGSRDKTVKLWDVQTGGVVKDFHHHTYRRAEGIISVSISVGSTMIASGFADGTICLWNIGTGKCHVIKGHSYHVTTISFSPTNPQLLLSASRGGNVRKWDTDGHQIGPSIPGFHVAFSPDGTQFVSCNGAAVTIWNTDSGDTVAEFFLAHAEIRYCCFSSDGKLIACASGHTIYLWNITDPVPHLIKTLVGHTDDITSLIFPSLTLISASKDESVKFWEIGALSANPAVPHVKSTSPTSAPIRAVSLQAKDGLAFSVDSAGVVRTWSILTGHCKESFETQAKDIETGDIQLIGDRLIIVGCKGNSDKGWKVHVWDAEKGELQTMDGTTNQPRGLRMSGDGSRVFYVDDYAIQAWTIQTGVPTGVESLKGWYPCHLDPLWIYGSKVIVRLRKSLALGWDFGILGSTPIEIFPISSDRSYLDFIGITSEQTGGKIGIGDIATGNMVFQLTGKKLTAVQWDGCHLIAGYDTGEVWILDFSNMLP